MCNVMWVLEHFSCLVLRPESVLPARVSGSAAHAGVCARAAREGLGAPAGPQTRALCVGHPAAVRAPEGPGVRVEGTAWGRQGRDLRAWAPGRGVQGHSFPSRRRVRGEGAGALIRSTGLTEGPRGQSPQGPEGGCPPGSGLVEAPAWHPWDHGSELPGLLHLGHGCFRGFFL